MNYVQGIRGERRKAGGLSQFSSDENGTVPFRGRRRRFIPHPLIPSSPRPSSPRPSSLIPHPSSFILPRRGFTLVEVLIVVVIIALLAALSMGALRKAQESARVTKTKATIAKLNDLVMQRYESYFTRRIPLNTSSLVTSGGTPLSAYQSALVRLYAVRDLMRMEMPERWTDVTYTAGSTGASLDLSTQPGLSSLSPGTCYVPEPALHKLYKQKGSVSGYDPHAGAKCLYMFIATCYPEALGQFTSDEIGVVDNDGWKVFLDGWGHPINFLRWAPGFSRDTTASTTSPPCYSDIQIPDPIAHHDPFDPRKVDQAAYQLIPLIYAGVLGKNGANDDYGINTGDSSSASITPTCAVRRRLSLPSGRRSRDQRTVRQRFTGGPHHQPPHGTEVTPCDGAGM